MIEAKGDFAHLSEEGKKELGHIFPNGIIPIFCMLGENATLQGLESVVQVYRIDLRRLTEEQKNKCFDYVAEKRNADRNIVARELIQMGFIPLQARWCCSSGTDQPYKYLPDFDFTKDEEDVMMDDVMSEEEEYMDDYDDGVGDFYP